jgi:hypothetical protein
MRRMHRVRVPASVALTFIACGEATPIAPRPTDPKATNTQAADEPAPKLRLPRLCAVKREKQEPSAREFFENPPGL